MLIYLMHVIINSKEHMMSIEARENGDFESNNYYVAMVNGINVLINLFPILMWTYMNWKVYN